MKKHWKKILPQSREVILFSTDKTTHFKSAFKISKPPIEKPWERVFVFQKLKLWNGAVDLENILVSCLQQLASTFKMKFMVRTNKFTNKRRMNYEFLRGFAA